jgi:hypothetical protein
MLKKLGLTVLWALGMIWAIPLVVIGFLVTIIYWPKGVRFHRGCLEFQVRRIWFGFKDTAGQTWGWLIVYIDPLDKVHPILLEHEHVHTKQGLILGFLFIIAYPIASLVAWISGKNFYMDNWFEVQARRISEQTDRIF